MSKECIKRKVDEWETERWNEERRRKSSIELYNECKVKIEDEDIYENDWGSVLLYRCRTNSLRLNWRECFCEWECELWGM